MTNLDTLFDVDLLESRIQEGFVRRTPHPELPLAILNYSEQAQYSRTWDEVTLNCRGLIYNTTTGKVVARGFHKFFNLGEHSPKEIPDGEAVVSTKFDGSLGILYNDGISDFWKIATRGSFTSDQAVKGTKILEKYNREIGSGETGYRIGEFLGMEGVTYLFEILYKENRIVVDYGDLEALVLLDVIDISTGNSRLDLFNEIPWPDKAYKATYTQGIPSDLVDQIPKGNEGFVLYWPENGFRVKVKSEEYVTLHRIVTGLSEKSVWEMLGEGKTVDEIKENVPDELYDWVDETARSLMDKAQYILDQASEDFHTALYLTVRDASTSLDKDTLVRAIAQMNRGAFAGHAASMPESRPFLFKMLDGAEHDVLWSMAWQRVKPVGDTRVWNKTT